MSNKNKRSFAGYIQLYFSGFIIGAANIIPGVSGGTMALLLGIYDELLEAISSFTSISNLKLLITFKIGEARKALPWQFVIVLGLGLLTSVGLLARPLKWMLHNELSLILGFFFGLVAASVLSVFARMGKWGVSRVIGLIIGTLIGWSVVGLGQAQAPPEGLWYLLFCGALAVSAMILPGISGSFILVLLGRLDHILQAVDELTRLQNILANLIFLGVFLVGAVLGLASFVRLLSWVLKRFRDATLATLAGFMIGSLRKIWPWKADDLLDNCNVLPTWSAHTGWAIGLIIFGFALVVTIDLAAKRIEKKSE